MSKRNDKQKFFNLIVIVMVFFIIIPVGLTAKKQKPDDEVIIENNVYVYFKNPIDYFNVYPYSQFREKNDFIFKFCLLI